MPKKREFARVYAFDSSGRPAAYLRVGVSGRNPGRTIERRLAKLLESMRRDGFHGEAVRECAIH